MSKENRKKVYDSLVAAGRIADIPDVLKKEFMNTRTSEDTPRQPVQKEITEQVNTDTPKKVKK